ncbi:MAG TPA: 4-oxalomesaconate tautomerase [Actinomycetaceae bacterium]|nr:4-oxalomesaconate tautomerase [Actinomycetaceae bacterium]
MAAHDGVRCMMMRAGTSRGLFFLEEDLPGDVAERNDLLLRLMGSPDARQIDGLGGATSLTSKVAVISRSESDQAEIDYLFLQLGVDEPTVSDQQNCGNILAGVAPFAIERGLIQPRDGVTEVDIRMVNSDSIARATVQTPAGTVTYAGDVAIAGVPGTAAPIDLGFTGTEGSATGALLPTGRLRDTIEGLTVTCIDNGMPVVVLTADSLGLSGAESHAELASNSALLERVNALRIAAGELMGLGDVSASSVPKTMAVAPARDGGQFAVRSFIPVQPHESVGVLAAISTATALLLPGAVGHELSRDWPTTTSRVDVEHPSGHLLIDVAVDSTVSPPRVERSGVVRTARKLFDGLAFPRS